MQFASPHISYERYRQSEDDRFHGYPLHRYSETFNEPHQHPHQTRGPSTFLNTEPNCHRHRLCTRHSQPCRVTSADTPGTVKLDESTYYRYRHESFFHDNDDDEAPTITASQWRNCTAMASRSLSNGVSDTCPDDDSDDVFYRGSSNSKVTPFGNDSCPEGDRWNPARRSVVQHAGRYALHGDDGVTAGYVVAGKADDLYDNVPPCYDLAIRRRGLTPRYGPLDPTIPMSLSPLPSPVAVGSSASSSSMSSPTAIQPAFASTPIIRATSNTLSHAHSKQLGHAPSSTSRKASTPARLRSITANLGLIFAKRSPRQLSEDSASRHSDSDPLTRSLPVTSSARHAHHDSRTPGSVPAIKMSTASLLPKKWRKSQQQQQNSKSDVDSETVNYKANWKQQVRLWCRR